MRLILTAAVTGLLGATVPSHSVSAQATYTPLGSNVPRPVRTRELDQEDIGLVRDEFARCVFAENRDKVANLLEASDPGGVDFEQFGVPERRMSAYFSMPGCLTEAQRIANAQILLSTNTISFRYMMLEADYLDRYPSAPAWLQGDLEVPEREYRASLADPSSAIAMASFADCIVAAAPAEADALLRTPSRSATETAAVQPLIPHLGSCLTEGQVLELRVENVRQFAAEGLWHLAGHRTDYIGRGDGDETVEAVE